MLNKKVGLLALLVTLSVNEIWAGTFTNYAVGDVVMGFRKAGGGANDLIVDAGQIGTLTNLAGNTRYAITNFNGAQLANVGTNQILWSAFSYFDDSLPTAGVPASAQWSLFVTKPRASLNAKTTAWQAAGQTVQSQAAGYMTLVVNGANDMRTYSALNTSGAVVEQESSQNNPNYPTGYSYSDAVQDPQNSLLGDFQGSFGNSQGSVEYSNTTSFTLQGGVARSDFYYVPPTGGGSVKYLGYFEMATNGAMTYVAYPTAPMVQTVAASSVTGTTAQLNSTVNPTNSPTTLYFQYGLAASYGSFSGTTNIGTTLGSYGLAVAGLNGGTTYHFRAVAYNQYGTNYGSDLNFTTTSSVPSVPVITSFSRVLTNSHVSFTTGASGTYTLRGTNSAGLSAVRLSWPAIASVSGNGAVNTLTDTNTDAGKFYIITAQ